MKWEEEMFKYVCCNYTSPLHPLPPDSPSQKSIPHLPDSAAAPGDETEAFTPPISAPLSLRPV